MSQSLRVRLVVDGFGAPPQSPASSRSSHAAQAQGRAQGTERTLEVEPNTSITDLCVRVRNEFAEIPDALNRLKRMYTCSALLCTVRSALLCALCSALCNGDSSGGSLDKCRDFVDVLML